MAAHAPSTHLPALQTARDRLESWFEAERDQLPLWLPVALGCGVTTWFLLPDPVLWRAALLASGAVVLFALAAARGGRAGASIAIAALAFAAGLALVWFRAERVAAPVLTRPAIVELSGAIERVDQLPARDIVRLRLTRLQWIDRTDRKSVV